MVIVCAWWRIYFLAGYQAYSWIRRYFIITVLSRFSLSTWIGSGYCNGGDMNEWASSVFILWYFAVDTCHLRKYVQGVAELPAGSGFLRQVLIMNLSLLVVSWNLARTSCWFLDQETSHALLVKACNYRFRFILPQPYYTAKNSLSL